MKAKKVLVFFLVFLPCCMIFSQENTIDIKYKRSSLHTLMITDDTREHSAVIQDIFTNAPLIDKFNNHIVNLRMIPKTDSAFIYTPPPVEIPKKKGFMSKITSELNIGSNKEEKEFQHLAALNYLNTNNIAKTMVAKWFNRSESGGFNMDLIAERGYYNASDLDVKIANNSERGSALLADAGEALIKSTFVIVNDFKYTNKEEVAKKAKSILASVSNAASSYGNSDVALLADATAQGAETFGKGYVIKTRAHLYKLIWNEETASIFYNDFWNEDGNIDMEKKKAFDETDIFKLEYIGTETSWADIQSTSLSKKTNEELISNATIKAIDHVIAKLQRKYEVFRTKTPLISSEPLAAKIGLKEGLEKGDKYEVLEQMLDKNGVTVFKRLGVIKVEKDLIWDNRHNANEENPSDLEYTTFSGGKKKYYAGMLIRQIN
ncbi:hypothetical protein Q4Q34_08925 [Flavivirga abyssicola]|uniref:hypothetical protein n=1 Tax=Flavivirga abyssicola TaxID=3063533 RepID=UPI0026DF2239|nr:hypothetical protein [Flavivirga sp. MEBiC07777]WVK15150.1 hypothetical protein Q4Q34_08925 [Flavivirga sp. MEBiC07777]